MSAFPAAEKVTSVLLAPVNCAGSVPVKLLLSSRRDSSLGDQRASRGPVRRLWLSDSSFSSSDPGQQM